VKVSLNRLKSSHMADENHLQILNQGADVWNQWRKEHPDIRPDLKGAYSFNTELEGVNLSNADLRGAMMVGLNLINADLKRSTLLDANLCETDLRGADLSLANISYAALAHTRLRNALLFRTRFTGSNLSFIDLLETIFADTDLSQTRGLEKCKHFGPSFIDFQTIQKSWPLPNVFLQGLGLPDSYIEYLPSLIGSLEPIQFYSCFVSYSHKDEEFAQRLYADLQSNGVRCWYAPEDMQGGRKIHHQIDDAIRVHDKLLLILSEQSMNSAWVENEIVKARKRELTEGKQVLFPLGLCEFKGIKNWELFYGDEGRDLAQEIREYFIPDFSNWKDHDSYKKAFDKLLKDLKASAVEPTKL
jgi:hypothetical protein